MNDTINFQDLFEGFQNTPVLWNTSEVYNFWQFQPKPTIKPYTEDLESKKLRLGKWVEQFVSFQLQNDTRIRILEENLQIKKDNITIGELDLLFLKDNQPIHLEIIYKFYLYDDQQDTSNPLNHWVGPNQNDALVYKLDKLKNKQLPLLHHPNTKLALAEYNLKFDGIKQNVCYKAQLFLPYYHQNKVVSPLNANCITGFYLHISDIAVLKNVQFYIPEKLEWLSSPMQNVKWLCFEEAISSIKTHIAHKRSPLCWIKTSTNELQKCFITWWK